jgi:hypothetical protein
LGVKAFPVARVTLIPKVLKVMRAFLTVGVSISQVLPYISDTFNAYIWALTSQVAKGTNFLAGPSKSIFHSFTKKPDFIFTNINRWDTVPPTTIVCYQCPEWIKRFSLDPKEKKKKTASTNTNANIGTQVVDNEFVIKGPIVELI